MSVEDFFAERPGLARKVTCFHPERLHSSTNPCPSSVTIALKCVPSHLARHVGGMPLRSESCCDVLVPPSLEHPSYTIWDGVAITDWEQCIGRVADASIRAGFPPRVSLINRVPE